MKKYLSIMGQAGLYGVVVTAIIVIAGAIIISPRRNSEKDIRAKELSVQAALLHDDLIRNTELFNHYAEVNMDSAMHYYDLADSVTIEYMKVLKEYCELRDIPMPEIPKDLQSQAKAADIKI